MTTAIPLLDLMSLLIETAEAPCHVAPLMIFELPAKSPVGAVAAMVASWRRAEPVAPFNYIPEFPRLGLPRWKLADEIDMNYHVRHIVLPAPGTMQQLRELLEVLHTDRLPRERPMFQVWVIDGLEGGCFAVYPKMHHSIIDGQSAVMRVIGSLSEMPSSKLLPPIHALKLGETKATARSHLGERLSLLGVAVARRATAVTQLYEKLLQQSRTRLLSRANGADGLFSSPHTRMNQPVGMGRSLALFSLPLARLRAAGKTYGGTLNDIVIAIVDAAVTKYLAAHGEPPAKRLVAGCPVSTRAAGDASAGTDATMIFVPLGDPGATPVARLETVIFNTKAAKAELKAMSKEAAKDYALIALVLSEGIGAIGLRSHVAPLANLAISNVAGPRVPLYLGRAKLKALYPISMLVSGIGLNVTLISTAEEMHFGIVAGAEVMADAQQFEDLCRSAFAAIEKSAARRRKRAPV